MPIPLQSSTYKSLSNGLSIASGGSIYNRRDFSLSLYLEDFDTHAAIIYFVNERCTFFYALDVALFIHFIRKH